MKTGATIRVLHSVGVYLGISENWIYPQIVQTPGTETRVVCGATANLETFPLDDRALMVSPPPRSRSGFLRLVRVLLRRVGADEILIRTKIKWWRPQLIHAHFGTRGAECLGLKRDLKVPLLTSFYGYDAWMLPQTDSIWRERYHELFSGGDQFLVEGPAMQKRLQSLGCPSEKIIIQRIGVSLDACPFEARTASDVLKIVMLGRFVEKKGLVDGLRACALACGRGVNLKVTIIGDAANGDAVGTQIKDDLKRIAQSAELSGKVQFTGFVPLGQAREILSAQDVFLCPSRLAASGDAEGGSPVALTEAMATGLVCVGTRHCDIPEVILDGQTGYLSEEGDVSGLAEILYSVGKGLVRRQEVTKAGRAHIEQKFCVAKQLGGLFDVYRSALKMGENGR